MTPTLPPPALLPRALSVAQFKTLAEVPPEIEWFANLTNANTRRAYEQDINDFMAFAGLRQPEQFRDITRAHVIAWREQLVGQELANDTIRRKLAALSSLKVGAVIVRAGRIMASAHGGEEGKQHAELTAIRKFTTGHFFSAKW